MPDPDEAVRQPARRGRGGRRGAGHPGAKKGFIHCSLPRQVIRVADALFRGQSDLVLLCIDPGRVATPIVHEGPEEPFPHIYGPLGRFPYLHPDSGNLYLRHVYHLSPDRPLPERWRHRVGGGGEDDGMLFECFWVPAGEAVHMLAAAQGAYLHLLRGRPAGPGPGAPEA